MALESLDFAAAYDIGAARRTGMLSPGPGQFLDFGPHLVFPAVVACDRQDDLVILGQDKSWRDVRQRFAFIAHQEGRQNPLGVGRPIFFLQHQCLIGRMDDAVIEFFAGFGLDEVRLGLGTPDLAAASKLVADENQHRPPRLGLRDTGP
jgi:hypothetical protein